MANPVETLIRSTVTKAVETVAEFNRDRMKTNKPHPYLTGVHEPMKEERTLTNLTVTGTIPVELEQAALIDGCDPWAAFTQVTLPLAAPALAITALFSFMAAWSEFLVARIVVHQQALYTLPLGLESLAGQFQTEWANYAAGSLLVCVPVMVLFVVLNRYLVSGLSLGGVKG